MNYLPIRLNTLRPGDDVFFDVFIRVGEKQIHYIHKSEPFESDRLTKLKTKGVKKLFVKEEEEQLYLNYLDKGLGTLMSKDVDGAVKGERAYDTMVTDAENAERNLETETSYKAVQGRVGQIINYLSSDKGSLKSILNAAGCALDDYQHSANVSSLATGLAVRHGKIPEKEVMDLALAGLLHDLGKTKLGFVGPIDVSKLKPDEKKSYRQHPEKGVELLASKPYVTPAILRLILEHEELGEGVGYPERKKLMALPDTSQFLSLANQFDSYCMARKLVPLQTVKVFCDEKREWFDGDHLVMLGELLSATAGNSP